MTEVDPEENWELSHLLKIQSAFNPALHSVIRVFRADQSSRFLAVFPETTGTVPKSGVVSIALILCPYASASQVVSAMNHLDAIGSNEL